MACHDEMYRKGLKNKKKGSSHAYKAMHDFGMWLAALLCARVQ